MPARKIPIWHGSWHQKDKPMFKYDPTKQQVIRLKCICYK